MKQKQILILTGLFLLLFLGVIVQKLNSPKEWAASLYHPLDFQFEPSDIREIRFQKGADAVTDRVTLQHDGRVWRIRELWGAKADPKRISSFLSDLGTAGGELRSSEAELLKDFLLEEGQAVEVFLADEKGQTAARFYLSPKRPDAESSFVRLFDSTDVFYVNRDLLRFLSKDAGKTDQPLSAAAWADYAILSDLDTEQVQAVQIIRREGEAAFLLSHVERKTEGKDGWRYVERDFPSPLTASRTIPSSEPTAPRRELPFPIDPAKVAMFLDDLKHVRAENILDPELRDEKMNVIVAEIHLISGDNSRQVIRFSAPAEDGYTRFLTVEGRTGFYEISNYAAGDLLRDDSRFFKENPLGIEKDAVEKIILNAGNKKRVIEKANGDIFSDYLNRLKRLEIRGIADLKTSEDSEDFFRKSPGRIEIFKTGTDFLTLDWGELAEGDGKEYVFRVDEEYAFRVSEYTYQELFGSLFADDSTPRES